MGTKKKSSKTSATTRKAKKREANKHTGRIKRTLKVDAFRVQQGDHTLYVFRAKASVLFEALSINRRIQDKEEGYQRVLSPSRVMAITRYVRQNRPLPGAIIVSLDKAPFADGELTIPAGTDVGWVIDGQHRLAGAAMAAKEGTDIDMPVVAFVGLTEANQIEQFITINREGKNVPTSLYLDLLHYLPNKKPGEVAKERAADLATGLRKDESSPFFDRIVVTSAPRSGQTISLTNFVRKIAIHVAPGKGILNAYTEREQYSVIANYYQGLRQVFTREFESKDSIFFKTVGFGALWNIFPTFFSMTLKNYRGFAVKDVAGMFRHIEDMDFSTWEQYGTGDQAERNAAEDLKAALLIAFNTGDDPTAALKLT
ncbi:MAG: DGQHR domain-containing protein [Thermoanaerobaculia bacterium]